ncbi:hypothetical protein [Lysobacter sp. D1-1-M9]|uniref:hypothetical protein n=1 Tax=Novilysobacter longmucuonensis TaxID=3098603 RepID=UPI002FC5C647
MLRICLCLLLAVASTSVTAREVKLSAPGGESCDDQVHGKQADRNAAAASAPSARETKVKPSVHSDAGPAGRMQSPRWHSFLPGMFR